MNAATRRPAGKDPRIVNFRGALISLIESLDATVRIARWGTESGPIPGALRDCAALLQDRLGSANRLAAGAFVGAPALVATSEAIKESVRALDTALVVFRRLVKRSQREQAALGLDGEVERVKLHVHSWE